MEKLKILIEHLRNQSELAVDLEVNVVGIDHSRSDFVFFSNRFQHHAYRSFQGLTCLMQISSRTRDFLIDTLILREELTTLNELFTDPKIVKVEKSIRSRHWSLNFL